MSTESKTDKQLSREQLAAMRERCEAATPWLNLVPGDLQRAHNKFVSHAVEDMAACLSYIESLEAELDRYRAALEVATKALGEIKPPAECPFCPKYGREPVCSECLSLARHAGRISAQLEAIEATLKGGAK